MISSVVESVTLKEQFCKRGSFLKAYDTAAKHASLFVRAQSVRYPKIEIEPTTDAKIYVIICKKDNRMTDAVLLRCISCRSINRVPKLKLGDRPVCGKCKTPLEYPMAPVEVTEANFVREVLENPGYALVFFWAPWCAHCRGMITIMKDLAREKAGIVKVAMINTERELFLARRFAVMSVPRLTLYRHGRIIDEVNGAMSSQQLNEWLTFALRKATV